MTVFTGNGVNIYRMRTVARALRLYAATGMKANSMYTPKNMMAKAASITGKKYKARDYERAAADLTAMADAAVASGEIRHG